MARSRLGDRTELRSPDVEDGSMELGATGTVFACPSRVEETA
jgi:hypothetical protein